ncbi:MAG: formylglycine-generating enzyme family protein [Prolixibacteraceae bacterium]
MRNYTIRLCQMAVLIFLNFGVTAQNHIQLIAGKLSKTEISGLVDGSGIPILLKHPMPLISYEICPKNDLQHKEIFTTHDGPGSNATNSKMEVSVEETEGFSPGYKALITFKNSSSDTLWLTNVVPFGFSADKICVTGKGDHPLSRSYLFRPGFDPVNCILPDNAWELGFTDFQVNDGVKIAALTRRLRDHMEKSVRHRFETEMAPGGVVQYVFYADVHKGNWQDGLRMIFQDRLLYDVDPGQFDNSLFERKDLKWVRQAYVAHLMMAWNGFFYDVQDQNFHLEDFVRKGKASYGGDDFIGIWPTWPTLGVDQRNQWDLFRDLPGGTEQLKKESEMLNKLGSRLFICYNPWDENTRNESHTGGMARLVAATSASGVVLDTRGASSKALQQAADSVRQGVIMYSEGMAIPKDMQGIVAGRVHNALYYCPMLNLNKIIKPEFAIFRVAEIYKEPIKREFCLSFFNGYGTELNIFAPGIPEWADEQYRYLGRIARIQRENSTNFTAKEVTPLLETARDKIWVNKWYTDEKTVFTIYSLIPEGFKDLLFEVTPKPGTHFIDLWKHEERIPVSKGMNWQMEAETDAFNQSWLGSNNEGEVDCVAQLPELITATLSGDELSLSFKSGDSIRIWAGVPDYAKKPLTLRAKDQTVRLSDHFGRYEGKFVIQLFLQQQLMDERIVRLVPGTPRLISRVVKTEPVLKNPPGMVKIPAGKFIFHTTNGDEFIPYPKENEGKTFEMPACFMDRFPVTNLRFKEFLTASGYQPADSVNFLRNWKNGTFPVGEEQFPVVHISYEDAQEYAKWAGKRLPTELEWQYAAQTAACNEWPWKQKQQIKRSEESVTGTLTVFKITGLDPDRCNAGDGKRYAAGSFPKGANPYGLQDLVGCVWQLTNDLYTNGSYRYIMMKGGSFFNPSSSWWYVQGGPRELHYRQFLLRVSEGFERNATVGFRCVKDAELSYSDGRNKY